MSLVSNTFRSSLSVGVHISPRSSSRPVQKSSGPTLHNLCLRLAIMSNKVWPSLSASRPARILSRVRRGQVRNVRVAAENSTKPSQNNHRRHALLATTALTLGLPARADEGAVALVQQADIENLSGYLRQVLEYNQRIQRQNNAPKEFPSFVRDKFDITVVADGYSQAENGVGFLQHSRRSISEVLGCSWAGALQMRQNEQNWM